MKMGWSNVTNTRKGRNMTEDKPNLVERLQAVDSCAVSDALDALGLPGAVTGIAAQSVQQRIAGRAVTFLQGAIEV